MPVKPMTTIERRRVSESSEPDVREKDGKEETLLSVVIAVRDPERAAPMDQLYGDYKEQFERVGLRYEFIFAVQGDHPDVIDDLRRLKEKGEPINILVFSKWYGGAMVLSAGFDQASGSVLITLPAYHQIEPQAIPSLFPALEQNDMVAVRRSPRVDGVATGIQVWTFHAVLRLLGFDFHDLGCSVIAFRREVLDTVNLYGDQHRFFPVLTSHHGFKVKEIAAPQTEEDTFQSHFSPTTYVHRLLDLLSVFFLTKFTRKPLRFFGTTSLVSLLAGGGITLALTIQRLFMGVPLQDKPLLLLGILLIVLGVLLLAIGLIGEMIIFTHAKDLEEYTVEKIID